ncbi:MAG: ABC transporter substrate-binding protein [Thermaerobacter sp.]|nr:ABC transporter substrate-binding protein [Thermaerobacter sp.]
MRRVAGMILLSSLFLTLSGCAVLPQGSTLPPPGTLNVGVDLELSGSDAPFAQDALRGMRLAVDAVNGAGGVLGYRLHLVVEDNAGSPDGAALAATKLIHDYGVVAILGPLASSDAQAVAPLADRARVPVIFPSATDPSLTSGGRGPLPYVFRACFTADYQGALAAAFARHRLGGGSGVFVLAERGSQYSKELADSFGQHLTALGGRLAGTTEFAPTRTDFRPLLRQALAAHAGMIYLPLYSAQAVAVIRQAAGLGYRGDFLGPNAWDNSNWAGLGSLAERCFFTVQYYAGLSPAARAFSAAYTAHYHRRPDTAAALGYDAAGVLIQAMRQAGSLDPRRVAPALAALKQDYPGATGSFRLDQRHDPRKPGAVVSWRGGRKVLRYLVPAQPAGPAGPKR